jgi:hypothetical protein
MFKYKRAAKRAAASRKISKRIKKIAAACRAGALMFLLAARKGVRESENDGLWFCPKTSGARPFVKFGLSLVRRPGPIYFVDLTKGNSYTALRQGDVTFWAAGARHVIRRRMSVKRFLNCLFDLSSQALCLCWTRPRAAP